MNATEHTRIVYAGHYAGLCYTTDGRTHQCTGDIAMMRSIPGMKVLYPAFEAEIGPMLEWYRSSAVRNPLYIRLHRTPAAEPTLDCAVTFEFGHGIPVRVRGAGVAVLTSGPHCVSACARASDALQQEGTAPDPNTGICHPVDNPDSNCDPEEEEFVCRQFGDTRRLHHFRCVQIDENTAVQISLDDCGPIEGARCRAGDGCQPRQ
ncbi:MAG: hypothetical protein HON70_03150 [Lentisphaerae bacterium]|nr:hypothetical protein [Lentisphaerota bacterium]